MKPASQSLVFTHTAVSLAISAAFVLADRAGSAGSPGSAAASAASTGLLEALRLLLAIGIAITLNQPEWREIFKPDSKPELAVLVDTSRSMETRDMPIDAAANPVRRPHAPAPKPPSRSPTSPRGATSPKKWT